MIITQTPLRISFAVGGTDYYETFVEHGGAVCSSAIDKFVYCVAKERFDDKIYINWSKKEIVDSVDQIEHDLVREAMKKLGVTKAVEISFLSDIPSEGSGLGSSSAVTVGVLHALYAYIGETPTAERLAQDACDIEVNRLGKPMGVQDQYIAAYGGLRHFQFGPGREVKTSAVEISRGDLEDLDNMLMLFYTGKTRKADTILSKQRANLAAQLDTLREMTRQAGEVRSLFESGNIAALGPMLHRGWEAKRRLTSGARRRQADLHHRQRRQRRDGVAHDERSEQGHARPQRRRAVETLPRHRADRQRFADDRMGERCRFQSHLQRAVEEPGKSRRRA